MKTLTLQVLSIPLALLALAPLSPKPVLEEGPSPHEWLQGLAGEWRAEGGGATASVPTESARTLGSYWIVASGTVPMGGNSIKYQRTLGYDSEAKQFIGTWVDSTSGHLWLYDAGSLDDEGETVTLEAEGPGFSGGLARYRETIQMDGPDRRIHENFLQREDGSWTSFEKSVYVREK